MTVGEGVLKGNWIFVVGEEPGVTRSIAQCLDSRGYQALVFDTPARALADLVTESPDLVILYLPGTSVGGFGLVRRIREVSSVSLMVVSPQGHVSAKLAALDQGVDDYVTHPFGAEELLARVRALLRRSGSSNGGDLSWKYHSRDLDVDLDRLMVMRCGEQVKLSAREWAVLRTLVRNAGRVVTHRALLQQAWGPEYGDEGDYVRTYITRLQKKLEPRPHHPRYILTERGIGYRLVDPGAAVGTAS